MNAGACITVASVCALLVAKQREWRAGEWTFKPLASTGFLLSAWQYGALDTAYGRAVMAALALTVSSDPCSLRATVLSGQSLRRL